MSIITLDEIHQARTVIAGKVHRTPLLSSHSIGRMLDINLFFKAELFQKTGSFKARGAINKINSLTAAERAAGVVAMSAGNHAAGLAYAASMLGVEATIVMPETASRSKIAATESYGGHVVLHGNMKELLPKVRELQAERGLVFVHPFDDPLIIAGQGTVGLEIIEDMPAPDVVVVPVGGGGLISGISTAIKALSPKTRVIGVEPVGSQAMSESLKRGEPVHLEHNQTIADGLAAPFGGVNTLAHAQRFVDEVVLVSDDDIIEALKLIMERCKVMPEPAGAAGLAALMQHKFPVPSGATVVCVLSGGNVDRSRLRDIFST